MHLNKLILCILSVFLSFNCKAAEMVLEPHAMLYYQVPFGSSDKDKMKHTYGFRMDRTLTEPGKPVDYQMLFRKPALFELKMGHTGVEALTIAGVDYLKQIRALRANGEDEAPVEEDAAADTPSESEPAEEKTTFLDKLPELSDIVEEGQYLGLTIGVLLAAGFLIGVGE